MNTHPAILAAGGATMDDVVKANAYLSDITLFERYNKVYATYFADPKPTRTTMGCQPPREGLVSFGCCTYEFMTQLEQKATQNG